MSGFENDVMVANNVNFDNTGAKPHLGVITTNGQLLIGAATTPFLRAGLLTSSDSSITWTFGPGTISGVVAGGTSVGKTITGNIGGPISPVAGNWNILASTVGAGTTPIQTSGSGNTLSINAQFSQAIASTNATRVGLAAFNSTNFSVDGNGFVSVISGGFTWTDVTSATQTLVAQNGYVTDRGGGVTYTLPASGTLGDTIKIVGKAGLATITPNANQQIVISSASGTVGATGTAVATNAGDCAELVCITAGASTVWRFANFVGNWTLN